MFSFEVHKQLGEVRLSTLTTPHGSIAGPFFQFVATQAAIRGLVFAEDLEKLGVQIVLANTYHLHVRPGEDIVAEAGGVHGFMNWNGPMTTDSGGYQVFSLGQLLQLDSDGVTFRSPLDGSKHRLTPEGVMEIQAKLGPDIVMPLDVCTEFGASHEYVQHAVEQTAVWAKRCKDKHEEIEHAGDERILARDRSDFPSGKSLTSSSASLSSPLGEEPARSACAVSRQGLAHRQVLYGIVQGSVYPDLRQRSAESLREIGFFGYSIGGELQKGEEKRIEDGVRMTTPHLPEDAPRYLMGYGLPEDIVGAVRSGVDHFDCVLPIRNARHGQLFYDLNIEELATVLQDPEKPIRDERLYKKINITRAAYARDFSLVSEGNPAIEKPYTKAYVHHLMRAETPSGMRLTVLHNIHFYVQLMQAIREIIDQK